MKLKNINIFWRVVWNFQALAVAVITHWKELFLIIENMHCIKSFKKFEFFLFCILYFDLFWNENGFCQQLLAYYEFEGESLQVILGESLHPANIYLFKFNERNIRKGYEISSQSTIATLEKGVKYVQSQQ